VLKWCCSVLLDLAKKVIPLPWTTGGPNDHSKPQEPTSISSEVSVVDPTYYYKDRVIDMKQLEAIKKNLPLRFAGFQPCPTHVTKAPKSYVWVPTLQIDLNRLQIRSRTICSKLSLRSLPEGSWASSFDQSLGAASSSQVRRFF